MSADRSILLANAGSGKTFNLANRVIAWSIAEIRAGRRPQPSHILAVTFTRKAAGQILARILGHAALGALPGKKGDDSRSLFEKVVGPATAEEYRCVLEALCDELHRMQVGTLDGFFHRIASAMPGEVGLPADWTIADAPDLAAIRAEAALAVLEHKSARDLLLLLEEGAPKPSVLSAIGGLLGGSSHGGRGATLLDLHRATEAGGRDATDRAWGWARRIAEARVARPAGELERLTAALAAAPLPLKKDGQPASKWVAARAKMVAALEAGDPGALADETAFAAMVNDVPFATFAPTGELVRIGADLAEHVYDALLASIRDRLEGAQRMLPIAAEALARAQETAALYDFSDVSRAVAQAAGTAGSRVADVDALLRGLGASVRDLAIDEAQDTSVAQFRSLRPLMERVLGADGAGQAGRFLLVGDPKQSIYGWRGGVPGLIGRIGSIYAAQLGQGDSLTASYRSSPIVMDLVNRVFGNLARDLLGLVPPDHLAEAAGLVDFMAREGIDPRASESAFKRAIDEWAFMPHEAHHRALPGWIEAYAYGKAPAAADGTPGAELDAPTCAAEVAARIHRERPGHAIAVLARANEDVAGVVARLKELGVHASDEGRSTLLDSPAVAAIVALVRLIDQPADGISHFIVSHGSLSAITGLAPSETHGTPDAAAEATAAYASARRSEIADHGLAAFIRGIFRALDAIGLSERDRQRVARVVAIAEDFDSGVGDEPRARLADFLEAIESDDSDAASSHRVRVMTVHASKGLEFDEVVLLGLDGEWGAAKGTWGTLSTDATKAPDLVAPLSNETVRSWIRPLQLVERDERRRRLLDDLSGLYVAITRARQGVHLVMDIDPGANLPTGSRLIAAAVDAAAGDADALAGAGPLAAARIAAAPSSAEPFWSVEYGARPASLPAPPAATEGAPTVPPQPLVEIVVRAGGNAAPPSSHAAALWQFDPFGDDDIALRGVLVHECFREVRTATDIDSQAKREAILRAARRRAAVEKATPIDDALVSGAEALLARCATGRVGAALAVAGDTIVRTELPFVRETAGGLVHGRIDRLELVREGGRVVRARVLDFKTGAAGADRATLARKCEGYFEQLSGYRDAVSEMYGLDAASIERVLLFVDRDEVVSAE
jgi:ATP-dependent helicase/nuclease subunit A